MVMRMISANRSLANAVSKSWRLGSNFGGNGANESRSWTQWLRASLGDEMLDRCRGWTQGYDISGSWHISMSWSWRRS